MSVRDINNFEDGASLSAALAVRIANDLRAAISKNGQASLALSGGRTPIPLFQALSQQDVDWDKVWVTLVDDRWVDVTHMDSNEALLRKHLLTNKATNLHFVGLKNAATTPILGLADAETALNVIPLPFTTIVLGMGDDGHTASWFPESPELMQAIAPQNAEKLAATNPVTAPHWRITLTKPVVLAASNIILHIVGEKKWAVYTAAQAEGDDNAMPIRHVLHAEEGKLDVYFAHNS